MNDNLEEISGLNITITGRAVEGNRCDIIPPEDETIADVLVVEELFPALTGFSIYYRLWDCSEKKQHLMIDLMFSDGSIYYFKFPPEMTEKQAAVFLKPVIDRLNENKKEKNNEEDNDESTS